MYHPLSGFTRIPQVFLYCSCGFFLFLFFGGGYKSQTNSEFTLVYGETSCSDLTISAQPAHCSHHLVRSLLFPAGQHHSHQVLGVHTQCIHFWVLTLCHWRVHIFMSNNCFHTLVLPCVNLHPNPVSLLYDCSSNYHSSCLLPSVF